MSKHCESANEFLTELERRVLNLVQADFPIAHAPYEELARQLGPGVTEHGVHQCITALIQRGVIRRLGGVFDTRKLGFMSALIAMRVPEERVDEVGGVISAYPGVSHNYRRDHEYNLWFTLAAPSREQLLSTLEEMKTRTGITDVLYLPTVRMHKIFVKFELPATAESGQKDDTSDRDQLTES